MEGYSWYRRLANRAVRTTNHDVIKPILWTYSVDSTILLANSPLVVELPENRTLGTRFDLSYTSTPYFTPIDVAKSSNII